MRVLHVIETLGRGGAERLLVTLLPALAAHGVTPAVAVLRGPYDLQSELEAAGIAVIRLKLPGKWRLTALARAIACAAQAHRADVVQAHLYFPGLGVSLMRLLRLHPATTVMTYHNLAYGGANRAGPKLRFRKALAAVAARRGMDAAMAVSEAVADHFAAALGLSRPEVAVIPNPVDPAVGAVPQAAVTDRLARIVVPGRLVPEKGHADLLAALPHAGLPEGTEVIFAGGGPLEARLRAEGAALGAKVTGWLDHVALLAEVARADLVVIPSRHEGFGIAAVEALALGRPVLASTAGGLPQALGSAARLVPPADPAALAAALRALSANPEERARLAGLGPAQAAQFAAPAIASRYAALYKAVTDRRNEP